MFFFSHFFFAPTVNPHKKNSPKNSAPNYDDRQFFLGEQKTVPFLGTLLYNSNYQIRFNIRFSTKQKVVKKKGQATKRTEKTCQLVCYPVSQTATNSSIP